MKKQFTRMLLPSKLMPMTITLKNAGRFIELIIASKIFKFVGQRESLLWIGMGGLLAR